MSDEVSGPRTEANRQTRGKSVKRRGQKQDDREVDFLRQQVADLTALAGSLAGDERIPNAIVQGVGELAAELRPLRDLRPTSTGLPPEGRVLDALGLLRASLASPDWSGAGSVSMENQNVAFIGEALPPPPPVVARRVDVFLIEEKERER